LPGRPPRRYGKRVRRPDGDLEDYLIGRMNQSHGCERTATFDLPLKNSPAFEVLLPLLREPGSQYSQYGAHHAEFLTFGRRQCPPCPERPV
jgi:hypothetical protein